MKQHSQHCRLQKKKRFLVVERMQYIIIIIGAFNGVQSDGFGCECARAFRGLWKHCVASSWRTVVNDLYNEFVRCKWGRDTAAVIQLSLCFFFSHSHECEQYSLFVGAADYAKNIRSSVVADALEQWVFLRFR